MSREHGGLNPAYSYVAEMPASQMVHAKNANPNARRLADPAERMTEDCRIFGGSDSKKIVSRVVTLRDYIPISYSFDST